MYHTKALKVFIAFVLVLMVSIVSMAFMVTSPALGATLFESYAQIFADSKPEGFIIQRYEHDLQKKELISTYYIQTSSNLGGVIETLRARCTEDFRPISYRYTDEGPRHTKKIVAYFKNNRMIGYRSDGGVKERIQERLPEGAFLSTFLGYLMLNKGYRKGVKFTFSAISEEEGKVVLGEAYIEKSLYYISRLKAFKLINKFNGVHFISIVGPKGDILSTESPVQKISTKITDFERVTQQGYKINHKKIAALFGGLPKGQQNVYAQQFMPSHSTTPSRSLSSHSQPAQPLGPGGSQGDARPLRSTYPTRLADPRSIHRVRPKARLSDKSHKLDEKG